MKYDTRCAHYVDMGEYNKPLCEKNGYRTADCALCPVHVESIESENAKLREYREKHDSIQRAKLAEIRAENAKLRELVRAFWWCTENYDVYDKCEQRCPLKQSSTLECECEVMMRELGIEVSDA